MEKNICRPFRILAQFPCTTSEKEVDYCLHRLNKQAAPRVTEQLGF